MADAPERESKAEPGRFSPQDVLGGLAMVALGALALWLTKDLAVGHAMRMGPGYLPRLLAWMVLGGGLIVTLQGLFVHGGGRLITWQFRGPFFVLGALILFGVTVRYLGIAPSSCLAVVFGSFASREARPVEVVILGVGLSIFCSLLFKVGLGLPLEIWPPFLIY